MIQVPGPSPSSALGTVAQQTSPGYPNSGGVASWIVAVAVGSTVLFGALCILAVAGCLKPYLQQRRMGSSNTLVSVTLLT